MLHVYAVWKFSLFQALVILFFKTLDGMFINKNKISGDMVNSVASATTSLD